MEKFYAMEENGRGLPSAIENKPEPFSDAIEYWVAFNELSSSRQSGMSIGHIPYNQISAYMTENDIVSAEERQRFRQIVTSVDNEFVKIQQQKSEQASERKRQRNKK